MLTNAGSVRPNSNKEKKTNQRTFDSFHDNLQLTGNKTNQTIIIQCKNNDYLTVNCFFPSVHADVIEIYNLINCFD